MGKTVCSRMKVDMGRSIRKLLQYGGLNGSVEKWADSTVEIQLIGLLVEV